VFAAFAELGISPSNCDFFLTHLHADHSGLVSELATETSHIYCSKIDAEGIMRFKAGTHWSIMGQLHVAHGFPEEILEETIDKHPASKNGVDRDLNFTFVEDGDMIDIGEYSFICVSTPGHTPGHVCLYDPLKRLLISGDHILSDITPNITVWPQMYDSLDKYIDNLDKIALLEVDIVLPGHRSMIMDCAARINEIKLHHEKRLAETLDVLSDGPFTAYQAAQKMTWDLSYSSWEEFPFPQKWFATGETAAHLEYLVQNLAVKKEICDGKYIFSLI
jgi:glyoxylase-like metal-dependent hydrolase (beta-lactamase superfamily II)